MSLRDTIRAAIGHDAVVADAAYVRREASWAIAGGVGLPLVALLGWVALSDAAWQMEWLVFLIALSFAGYGGGVWGHRLFSAIWGDPKD